MVRGNVDIRWSNDRRIRRAGIEMIDEGPSAIAGRGGLRLKMAFVSAGAYLNHHAEHQASDHAGGAT